MMKYDPEKHHRRSIRLKGYDYSQTGAYFVTICTQNRECLFGEVVDGEMRLNAYGAAVLEAWQDLPNHYPNVALDVFVVMPNHVHGVVVLITDDAPVAPVAPVVGAGFKPAPTETKHTTTQTPHAETKPDPTETKHTTTQTPHAETKPDPTETKHDPTQTPHAETKHDPTQTPHTETKHDPTQTPHTETKHDTTETKHTTTQTPHAPTVHGLPEIIRAFKTFSARRINALRKSPGAPVWQRNYYEHIIRNEESLNRIRQYILDNPLRWAMDRENPGAVRPEPEGAWWT